MKQHDKNIYGLNIMKDTLMTYLWIMGKNSFSLAAKKREFEI